ncbi:hypothetical protein KKG48_02535 [Patescibacteria group bacterium]|nr:hypothetical protein [Patescibacteria group bacterium]MCG2695312.1 hypothetical protein [Candidatus Parcubacteria bacterium]
MSILKSTAVLIHGLHLGAKDWDNIFWGNPKNGIFGRGSKGVDVAFRCNASLIFWGTGSSKKDGKFESQYSFDYAIEHSDCIMKKYLKGVSFTDIESQTTLQEVARCMEMCRERGIEKLVLVSSPTHIARCLQSAEVIRTYSDFANLQVFATASDTCYFDSVPSDVLIVEPPHRGDRAEIPLHKTLRLAMFARKLPGEQSQQFDTELIAFFEQQKKKYLG